MFNKFIKQVLEFGPYSGQNTRTNLRSKLWPISRKTFRLNFQKYVWQILDHMLWPTFRKYFRIHLRAEPNQTNFLINFFWIVRTYFGPSSSKKIQTTFKIFEKFEFTNFTSYTKINFYQLLQKNLTMYFQDYSWQNSLLHMGKVSDLPETPKTNISMMCWWI